MADTVALRVAVTEVDRSAAELRKLGTAADSSFKRIQDSAGGMSRAAGARMQQVGFQVQDLIVQLQGGARPLTAFVQQGTQIAGAFGPVGSILGAVGAGAAIAASAILSMGSATDRAANAATAYDEAQKALNGTIGASYHNIDQLIAKYRSLSDEMRGVALLDLEAALRKNDEAVKKASESLSATLRELGGNRQQMETMAGSVFGQGTIFDKGAALPSTVTSTIDVRAALTDQLGRLSSGATPQSVVAEMREIAKLYKNDATDLRKQIDALAEVGKNADELAKARQRIETEIALVEGRRTKGDAAVIQGEKAFTSSGKSDAERAAERAQSYRNDFAQRQAMQELEAQSARRQREAIEIGTEALALETQRAEVERLVLQERQRAADAGVTLSAVEIAGLRERTEETIRLRDETKKLGQDWQATDNDRALRQAMGSTGAGFIGPLQPPAGQQAERELQRDAERQARIFTAPFERAAGAMQDVFSDLFESIMSDGDMTAGELADRFAQAMTSSVAQLPALLASAPMTSAINGLSDQLKDSFKSGKFSELLTSPMAMGAAGIGIGSLASGMMGGNSTGSSIGGMGGALAGALLGSYFPVVGTAIGALIGGGLGGVVGGLFGNDGGGNNRAGARINLGTGLLTEGTDAKSGPNQQLANSVAQQLLQMQGLLGAGGARFGDLGDLRVRFGDKTGAQLTMAGSTSSYGGAAQLTEAALAAMIANQNGLSETFKTVLAATTGQKANVRLDALTFAQTFEELVDPASSLVAAFNTLNTKFDQAAVKAKEYGLSIEAVRTAQEEAQAAMLKDAEDGLRSQVDSVRQAFASMIDPIKATLLGFQTGGLSALDPGAQLAAARADFQAMASRARSGDEDAIRAITGSAQGYLQEAREYGASGAAFQSVFSEVNSVLGQLQTSLTAQRDDVLSVVPDAFRDVSREQTAALKAELQKVTAAVERLQTTMLRSARSA